MCGIRSSFLRLVRRARRLMRRGGVPCACAMRDCPILREDGNTYRGRFRSALREERLSLFIFLVLVLVLV